MRPSAGINSTGKRRTSSKTPSGRQATLNRRRPRLPKEDSRTARTTVRRLRPKLAAKSPKEIAA
eukprot:11441841-Alexandrium_andersonii.AAC.1